MASDLAYQVRVSPVDDVSEMRPAYDPCKYRYSIMPGHITNPLFATVGISFWVYMITIVLGLPKQLVLTALGYPNLNSGHQGGVRAAKVIAFAVLIVVSIIATWIVRKRYNARLHEVAAERGHESPSAKYQGTYVSRARAMQSKA